MVKLISISFTPRQQGVLQPLFSALYYTFITLFSWQEKEKYIVIK